LVKKSIRAFAATSKEKALMDAWHRNSTYKGILRAKLHYADRVGKFLKRTNRRTMTTLSGPDKTKARKKHRCNYCQYPINIGDTYLRSTHVAFGDMYTWKSHEHCDKIAEKLKMFEDAQEGLTSDDFIEEIKSEYSRLDPEGDKTPPKADFKDYLDFVLSHHLNIE
jgi:hypothetical protein